jgi:hypothetical protein
MFLTPCPLSIARSRWILGVMAAMERGGHGVEGDGMKPPQAIA